MLLHITSTLYTQHLDNWTIATISEASPRHALLVAYETDQHAATPTFTHHTRVTHDLAAPQQSVFYMATGSPDDQRFGFCRRWARYRNRIESVCEGKVIRLR